MTADRVTEILKTRPSLSDQEWLEVMLWLRNDILFFNVQPKVAEAGSLLGKSKSEIRRNGIRINGKHTNDPDALIEFQNGLATVQSNKTMIGIKLLVWEEL